MPKKPVEKDAAVKKSKKSDVATKAKAPVDDRQILLTKEGLKKIKEELEQLRNVKRREVAGRIKEAISYGDLSENSEYEDAKNEQAFIEGRIIELEIMVKNAQIIHEKQSSGRSVQLGTTVVIKNLSSGNKLEEYVIVGSTEADPLTGKISNESPVGCSLLERSVGEQVDVLCPCGTIKYKIMELK